MGGPRAEKPFLGARLVNCGSINDTNEFDSDIDDTNEFDDDVDDNIDSKRQEKWVEISDTGALALSRDYPDTIRGYRNGVKWPLPKNHLI